MTDERTPLTLTLANPGEHHLMLGDVDITSVVLNRNFHITLDEDGRPLIHAMLRPDTVTVEETSAYGLVPNGVLAQLLADLGWTPPTQKDTP